MSLPGQAWRVTRKRLPRCTLLRLGPAKKTSIGWCDPVTVVGLETRRIYQAKTP